MTKTAPNLQLSIYKFLWIFSLIFLGNACLSCQSEEAQNNAAQTQQINRDWSKYPAIIELETENDIFVIGDIHGDYEGLIELLLASEIISKKPANPENVKWTAGNSLLVIPGDFISKGPKSVDVILLLRALQKSAAKQGGRIILTFGNHEAEFFADTKNVKVKRFRKELKALSISNKAVANGKDEMGIGQFLRNLPFAARVNDWYFVHAGHPKKYSIKELESLIIKGVENEGFDTPILLSEEEGILEVRMNPRPWWEKRKDDKKDSKSRLRNLLDELGVNHIVVGHQPGTYSFSDGESRKKGKMFQKFNGMIFFVDTGMESKKSDGAVLHIHQINGRETATIIFPGKKKTKELWSEK
jgi:hypothetical protein